MKDTKILVVSQDSGIRSTIRKHVEAVRYLLDEAEDGIKALKLMRRKSFDVVVVDRDLPELDAYYVCKNIKKNTGTPIIVLSNHSTEEEMLSYFNIGIDDFMHKPFSCRELVARIRVILRYTKNLNDIPKNIYYEELYIDVNSHEVYVQERTVTLSPKEFMLLCYLASNPGRALSREKILAKVWGEDFYGSDRTVDTHIKSLRHKIAPYDKYICTVWGHGYMFKVQ